MRIGEKIEKAPDRPVKMEKSCGAVVFTRTENGIEYLLIKSREGVWGFPKGHVEPGETERETATREILEETGISVKFLEGFRTEDEYPISRKDGRERVKRVVFFLAEYEDQTFWPQAEEISEICLAEYDEAIPRFRFESTKRILTEADEYLRSLT